MVSAILYGRDCPQRQSCPSGPQNHFLRCWFLCSCFHRRVMFLSPSFPLRIIRLSHDGLSSGLSCIRLFLKVLSLQAENRGVWHFVVMLSPFLGWLPEIELFLSCRDRGRRGILMHRIRRWERRWASCTTAGKRRLVEEGGWDERDLCPTLMPQSSGALIGVCLLFSSPF